MCNCDPPMIKGLSCPVCREEFGGGNPSRNFLAEKVIRALNVLRADPNSNKRSVGKNLEKVDAEKVVLETGAQNLAETQNTENQSTENLVEVKIEHDSEPQAENVSDEIVGSELPNDNLFESEMSDSQKNESNFENQTESQAGTEENFDAENEPEIKLESNKSEFDEEQSENKN